MTHTLIAPRAALLLALAAAGCGPIGEDVDEAVAASAAPAPAAAGVDHPSFLYGRITTVDGDAYQGRIRFGGTQEAFWADYFNGFKDGNPWVAQAPDGAVPGVRSAIRVFGLEIRPARIGSELRREFMVRFGDIAKLEARGRDLTVTLRNGSVVELDRYSADDFADGVRVWDATHGVVDFDERRVRTIEFLPFEGASADSPYRLHGTVHARQGVFTGFLDWGARGSVALDELRGHDADGELRSLPFATVRSVARLTGESARVTLLDGSELVLSDSREIGEQNRGIFVDDARYGRVLVSWSALDQVELTPVGALPGGGPSYDDFPAGRFLTGTVRTRTGRTLTGRLVYDLDESETIETLDAPAGGVTYTIPFALLASIALDGDAGAAGPASVTLRSGEQLQLERAGDLGGQNAGVLVFVGGGQPEYVAWSDIERIDFGG